jgi:hypothetical protein
VEKFQAECGGNALIQVLSGILETLKVVPLEEFSNGKLRLTLLKVHYEVFLITQLVISAPGTCSYKCITYSSVSVNDWLSLRICRSPGNVPFRFHIPPLLHILWTVR